MRSPEVGSPGGRGCPPETWLAPPAGPWPGPIPVADIDSTPFWDGLRRHELAILRCAECRTFVHPPQASCPRCLSLGLVPEPVSGRGTVYSFTVANREFAPGVKPPYVVALVDLEEQESLRVVTNLVNVAAGDVRIGMGVRVLFCDLDLDNEDATLAFFEPDDR
ncbi:MAG: hypothetical protein QOF96_3010 [Actinomycetota bacterium]|nr:hypothetical protein [Actinomycetota bacterium]